MNKATDHYWKQMMDFVMIQENNYNVRGFLMLLFLQNRLFISPCS